MGLFGNLFDLNFDGKATPFEELVGIHIMNQCNTSNRSNPSPPRHYGCPPRTDDLNLDELALMDEDERSEYLEEVGYDPDAFEF